MILREELSDPLLYFMTVLKDSLAKPTAIKRPSNRPQPLHQLHQTTVRTTHHWSGEYSQGYRCAHRCGGALGIGVRVDAECSGERLGENAILAIGSIRALEMQGEGEGE